MGGLAQIFVEQIKKAAPSISDRGLALEVAAFLAKAEKEEADWNEARNLFNTVQKASERKRQGAPEAFTQGTSSSRFQNNLSLLDERDKAYDLIHMTFRKLGCSELVGKVHVSFNDRFTARLGDAHYTKKQIRLSAPLWPRATEVDREETVIHEACHIVTRHFYGGRASAHGREWANFMIRMNLEPKRCHNIDRTGLVRGYRMKVHCQRCRRAHQLGPTQTKRFQSGATSYRCPCGTPLYPSNEV